MIEIRTIGAGGGSIAAVDAGGRLTVGPRSAGARPGPVCYGRGGSLPTVTDANLVLGRLDGAFFLGGAMALNIASARAAIDSYVAQPLGLSTEAAALGILSVANVSLAAAVRLSLFEKGLDPRDFGLLSFGGAGGVHAIPVAEELGVSEVIFPQMPAHFQRLASCNRTSCMIWPAAASCAPNLKPYRSLPGSPPNSAAVPPPCWRRMASRQRPGA